MPLRLPNPDPRDPAYQQLERKVNFALHVAIFAATDSGIWFLQNLYRAAWQWPLPLTGVWLLVLSIHGIWAFSSRSLQDKNG